MAKVNRDSNRVVVCGGRDFNDRQAVIKAFQGLPVGTIIVHGDCSGADRLAAEVAENWGLETEAHPADWKKHGKAAGPIRNQEMIDSEPRYVIAFPGGSGTADCIARAEAAGIQVKKVAKPKEVK